MSGARFNALLQEGRGGPQGSPAAVQVSITTQPDSFIQAKVPRGSISAADRGNRRTKGDPIEALTDLDVALLRPLAKDGGHFSADFDGLFLRASQLFSIKNRRGIGLSLAALIDR